MIDAREGHWQARSRARDAGLAVFRASLEPLRNMSRDRPFIGGASPLYPDYTVFGAF